MSGAHAILGRLPVVFRDQFKVEEILGQGATSMAVRARQLDPGRDVVIKVLLCDEPGSRARFLIEARALAEIDHPNVIHLFGSGETQDLLYMVLEFLPGKTLQQRMKSGPLTAPALKTLATGIASGLAAIHAKDILHRDLKPANIWCLEDGSPRLLDFGLARQGEGAGVTQVGMKLGTPGYSSPEQLRGDPLDHHTDLYSMGLIFYEMVTGAQPSERRPGDSHSIRIRLEKDLLAPQITGVPSAFNQMVGELLAQAPTQRPEAAAVLARIEAMPWGQPSAATRREGSGRTRDSARVKPPRSGISRRATLLTGMMIAALSGIVITATVVRYRQHKTSAPVSTAPVEGDDASPATDDPLTRFRELHARLYAGIDHDRKLDGRYWIQLLVNLSRAAKVPFRSLNELIALLEKAGTLPTDRLRASFELLATGARQALADIAPEVPGQLNAPGSAMSRNDRWLIFECLVPFLLLDRVLAVQGLADLQIGTAALLEKADLSMPPVADPRGGWTQLRHYLHRPGDSGKGFESINLANAGFFPEERVGQNDPLSHTPVVVDQFVGRSDLTVERTDLTPGAGTAGALVLQLVSWAIMGNQSALSDQDLIWVSVGKHRPFPMHAALASSFEYANAINPQKKPVVLSRSLPRRLLEPGAACELRLWREVVPSSVTSFVAQTDVFVGWVRLVDL